MTTLQMMSTPAGFIRSLKDFALNAQSKIAHVEMLFNQVTDRHCPSATGLLVAWTKRCDARLNDAKRLVSAIYETSRRLSRQTPPPYERATCAGRSRRQYASLISTCGRLPADCCRWSSLILSNIKDAQDHLDLAGITTGLLSYDDIAFNLRSCKTVLRACSASTNEVAMAIVTSRNMLSAPFSDDDSECGSDSDDTTDYLSTDDDAEEEEKDEEGEEGGEGEDEEGSEGDTDTTWSDTSSVAIVATKRPRESDSVSPRLRTTSVATSASFATFRIPSAL